MEKNYKIRFTVQHLVFIALFIFVNIYLHINYGPIRMVPSIFGDGMEEGTHIYNVMWLALVTSVVIAWLVFVLNKDWKPFGEKDDDFYKKWSFGSDTKTKRSWIFWIVLV